MAKVEANGIEIEYEEFGDPSGEPLLLVMGLGAQMIVWDEGFCELLARRGFRVVRYDNRDVGLSTKLDGAGVPDLRAAMAGEPGELPYRLEDMADDAAGLLGALQIEAAHVVGASMGGMIAQLVAVRHPAQVLSLTSIMSDIGGPTRVPARPEALAILFVPMPEGREERIEQLVRGARVLAGSGFPFDEERVRAKAARRLDRSYYPDGFLRQAAAVIAAPSRAEGLGGLTMPVLVIHGEDDPLVPAGNGRQTAEAVPGSRLVLIPGMGHDLPEPVWDQVVAAITEVAAAARGAARS